MTTALIDADIIAFRAAAKVQDRINGELVADSRVAIREADHLVSMWTKYVKPHVTLLCFSCSSRTYFRHDIYPEYKAQRRELERPPALSDVIEHLKKSYRYLEYRGLEADDVMGIYGTNPELTNPVIVSIDKDMQTVPAKWLNPDKMRRPLKQNAGMADLLMFKQALTGDSTDNYRGIPGIGPKKADAIIGAARQGMMWRDIEAQFIDAGLTSEYALTMVRLARILRFEDYNFETGEVRLWHPTHPRWMTPSTLNTTSSEAESKPSTTSSASAETSPETKQSTLPTSSSMSADTDPSETVSRPASTSRNASGISKGSSTAAKRKRKKHDEDSNSREDL
jgi:DNA polymerase-1